MKRLQKVLRPTGDYIVRRVLPEHSVMDFNRVVVPEAIAYEQTYHPVNTLRNHKTYYQDVRMCLREEVKRHLVQEIAEHIAELVVFRETEDHRPEVTHIETQIAFALL